MYKNNIKAKEIFLFIAAFVLPVVFVSIGYKLLEIYPFGEKSVMSMDLWGQYYSMIKAYWYDLRSLNLSVYSWDGGLGFNNVAQNMYYCKSIFFLPLVFVSADHIIQALDILLLIKYGFFGVSFLIFLKYKYKKISLVSVAFSTAYALCSYGTAYLNQPMWTDCLIYFPIIMVGIERLVKEKKPVLYTLILALTLYTSFYISFSVCIFSVLYFAVIMITEETDKKQALFSAVRFFGYSLIAGGLAAFGLLAVFAAILNRSSDVKGIEGLEFYHSVFDIAKSLFVGTEFSYGYFVPNIYSGFFVVPFTGLFFGSKDIKPKKKIAFAVLIAFLILSLDFNVLDYIWHGFHFPNQLPGRWTFIFSFVLLITAYDGLIGENEHINITLPQILCSIAAFLLIFILGLNTSVQSEEAAVSISNTLKFGIGYIALICLLYAAGFGEKLYIQRLKGKKKKKALKQKNKDAEHSGTRTEKVFKGAVCLCISLVIIAETGLNTGYTMKNWYKAGELVHNYFFDENMEEIRSEVLDKDVDLYRTEMNTGWTFNPGLLFDYKGVSYYSSTMNGGVYNLLKDLGSRVYAENVSIVYNSENNVLNSILGIKYVIDRSKNIDLSCYDVVKEADDYRVIKNKNCLPLAFPVNDGLSDWNKDITVGALDRQNDFLKRALGTEGDVFTQMSCEKTEITNAEFDESENWFENYYRRTDGSSGVSINYSFVCSEDGAYYVQHNFRAGEINYTAGAVSGTIDIATPVSCIGSFKKGDRIKFSFSSDNIDYGLCGLELFKFDGEKFSEMAAQLKTGGLEVEEFSDTYFRGSVTSENDNQLYFTSIPDDGGWSVYCDGEKLETDRTADALISFRTPKGEHEIEFVYYAKGYRAGALIAAVCWIILIWLNFRHRIKSIITKITKNSKK
ncbi:MAG: YfhO family protein [Clostridiales bacterium]|nr:YfhO family protein [Clostridiales bacterium]